MNNRNQGGYSSSVGGNSSGGYSSTGTNGGSTFPTQSGGYGSCSNSQYVTQGPQTFFSSQPCQPRYANQRVTHHVVDDEVICCTLL